MLLQTQISGTLDALAICAWLLGIIVVLIAFIWRSNDVKSNERHQDLINLIKEINTRQNGFEDKLKTHDHDIVALKTVVRLLQGKKITLQQDEEN